MYVNMSEDSYAEGTKFELILSLFLVVKTFFIQNFSQCRLLVDPPTPLVSNPHMILG